MIERGMGDRGVACGRGRPPYQRPGTLSTGYAHICSMGVHFDIPPFLCDAPCGRISRLFTKVARYHKSVIGPPALNLEGPLCPSR